MNKDINRLNMKLMCFAELRVWLNGTLLTLH